MLTLQMTFLLSLDDVRSVVGRYAGETVAERDITNVDLFRLALTHHSINQTPNTNGERLEFLGDAVLGCVAAEYLYQRYRTQDEGFMSRMRVHLVCGATLSRLCSRIPLLIAGIRMSHAVEQSGGRSNPDVLEDALEAFVGAIFMDVGGFAAARAWLVGLFEAEIDFAAAVLLTASGTCSGTGTCTGTGMTTGAAKGAGIWNACRPSMSELMRRCQTGDAKPRFTLLNVTTTSTSPPIKLFHVAALVSARTLGRGGGEELVEAGHGVAPTMAVARTMATRMALARMDHSVQVKQAVMNN